MIPGAWVASLCSVAKCFRKISPWGIEMIRGNSAARFLFALEQEENGGGGSAGSGGGGTGGK